MKIMQLTAVLLAAMLAFSSCHSSKYLRKFKKKACREVGKKNVKLKRDTVRITYPEITTFEFAKDEVKPEAKASLQHLSAILNDFGRINFVINGYTDNVGPDDVNQSLSQRRADNTKAEFVTNRVDAGRMTTHGMGSKNPVSTNGTDEGRQANRRVEFLMYDKDHKDKKKK